MSVPKKNKKLGKKEGGEMRRCVWNSCLSFFMEKVGHGRKGRRSSGCRRQGGQ